LGGINTVNSQFNTPESIFSSFRLKFPFLKTMWVFNYCQHMYEQRFTFVCNSFYKQHGASSLIVCFRFYSFVFPSFKTSSRFWTCLIHKSLCELACMWKGRPGSLVKEGRACHIWGHRVWYPQVCTGSRWKAVLVGSRVHLHRVGLWVHSCSLTRMLSFGGQVGFGCSFLGTCWGIPLIITIFYILCYLQNINMSFQTSKNADRPNKHMERIILAFIVGCIIIYYRSVQMNILQIRSLKYLGLN